MANRVVVMTARPGRIKGDVAVALAASAALHGEDVAGVLGAEGGADGADPRRGAEDSMSTAGEAKPRPRTAAREGCSQRPEGRSERAAGARHVSMGGEAKPRTPAREAPGKSPGLLSTP